MISTLAQKTAQRLHGEIQNSLRAPKDLQFARHVYFGHRQYEERLRSELRMPATLRNRRERAALIDEPPKPKEFTLNPLHHLPSFVFNRPATKARAPLLYSPLPEYEQLTRFRLADQELPLIARPFSSFSANELLAYSAENHIRENLPSTIIKRLEKDLTHISVSNNRHRLIRYKNKGIPIRAGVIGIKRGMMSHFDENGHHHPVTIVQIEGCQVLRSSISHRKSPHQRYAVYVAASNDDRLHESPIDRLLTFRTAGICNKKALHRFFVSRDNLLPAGTPLRATHFTAGQKIDVVGRTHDKGFQGVVKRYGFAGGRASHGTTKNHRRTGAINNRIGRVWPGTKMPGHMGNELKITRSLRVLDVDPELNIVRILGTVHGPTGGFVRLTDAFLERKSNPYTRLMGPVPTDFQAVIAHYKLDATATESPLNL